MCEERERLIGYVYDECDPAERQAIEEHLASCHTCRREIAGLRSVRQDLLAWEVPKHESVWRPMAPPPVESPWKAIPAWAMAAAAAVILAVGAAGGAVTYALLPHEAPTSAQAAINPQTVPVRIGPTELSAMEQRLLETVRAEFRGAMSDRVAAMSARDTQPGFERVSATPGEFERLRGRVDALTSQQEQVSRTLVGFLAQTQGLNRSQARLQNDMITMASLTQGNAQGIGGR